VGDGGAMATCAGAEEAGDVEPLEERGAGVGTAAGVGGKGAGLIIADGSGFVGADGGGATTWGNTAKGCP
jgi:hypothetical protein